MAEMGPDLGGDQVVLRLQLCQDKHVPTETRAGVLLAAQTAERLVLVVMSGLHRGGEVVEVENPVNCDMLLDLQQS